MWIRSAGMLHIISTGSHPFARELFSCAQVTRTVAAAVAGVVPVARILSPACRRSHRTPTAGRDAEAWVRF
jgi:hypothetical protein